MTIFIICMVAVVFVSGAIGGTLAYILSLRNEIRHLRNRIEVWDHDYLNLSEMCSMMSQHYAEMMDNHEKALEELEEEKDDLRKQLEDAQEEIIKYKVYTKDELLAEDTLDIKPLPDGLVAIDLDGSPNKYIQSNAIREATKDLDFPPVGKIEEDPTDFWPTNIIKPDAISKFLNRQAKKEE
jgi:hypothetical protein